MIEGFDDKATGDLYHGRRTKRVAKFPADLVGAALRKLDMLNAAQVLEDLRVPPGNRLEALKGDRAGQHSIRVNDQWRLVFRWGEGGPAGVSLVDYHS